MLKAKTKILYDLASDGGDKIASSDRDKITKVYKRLRTAQKQIEKNSNEQAAKRAIQKEKNFLQKKVETMSPTRQRENTSAQNDLLDVDN